MKSIKEAIQQELSENPSQEGGGEDDLVVDNKVRKDWNDYTDWLEKKGLKGHPSLDKGDLGGKMVDQYKKENPNSIVSRQTIKPIQKEFSNYRNYALNEIKNKRAGFAEGTNEENFMRALSVVDGIAGQRTTSFKFPDRYLRTFEVDNSSSIKDMGFAIRK